MNSTAVESFEQIRRTSLLTVKRTTTETFDETLRSHLEQLAVGVPLSVDGVSLTDHPVTVEPTPAELDDTAVGVTPAGLGVVKYGIVVVPSDEYGGAQISLYAETHIVVLAARTS